MPWWTDPGVLVGAALAVVAIIVALLNKEIRGLLGLDHSRKSSHGMAPPQPNATPGTRRVWVGLSPSRTNPRDLELSVRNTGLAVPNLTVWVHGRTRPRSLGRFGVGEVRQIAIGAAPDLAPSGGVVRIVFSADTRGQDDRLGEAVFTLNYVEKSRGRVADVIVSPTREVLIEPNESHD